MKLLVLAAGDPQQTASTIFRVAQFGQAWAKQGVDLHYIQRPSISRDILAQVRSADVVLNQKCVLNTSLGKAIRQASRRRVFDFDDAVWTRPGSDFSWFTRWRATSRLRWWMRESDVVIAANGVLSEWARPYARCLREVGMALDLSRWSPAPTRIERNFVQVGWTGSPAYIHLLEELEPAMAEALRREPRLRFAIYSGARPAWKIPFEYVPYSPGTDVAFVRNLDIGLLPMHDDEFARGKSPIKALQYQACGIPVVGNLVGAANELVDTANGIPVKGADAWTTALVDLARDPARRRHLGENGLSRVRQRHDANTQAERQLSILLGDS